MSSSHRAAVAAFVVILGGCSGGAGTSVPPAAAPVSHDASSAMRMPMPMTSPAASGTLYIASIDSVYAVPLGANGSTTAQRTITPHPKATHHLVKLVATSADGSLDILEMYYDGPDNAQQQHCRVVVFPSDANGSVAGNNVPCDTQHQTQGLGIARNRYGGFDLLYIDVTAQSRIIRRFGDDGASVINALDLQLSPAAGDLATDAAGRDYIDTSRGEFVIYNRATTDRTMPGGDFTIDSPNGIGVMAVAPDKTIYFVNTATGPQSISVIAPGGTTVSRSIGPFGHYTITALAVDAAGNLYAGMTPSSGPAEVRVYSSTASGKEPAQHAITVSPSVYSIRGLAISE